MKTLGLILFSFALITTSCKKDELISETEGADSVSLYLKSSTNGLMKELTDAVSFAGNYLAFFQSSCTMQHDSGYVVTDNKTYGVEVRWTMKSLCDSGNNTDSLYYGSERNGFVESDVSVTSGLGNTTSTITNLEVTDTSFFVKTQHIFTGLIRSIDGKESYKAVVLYDFTTEFGKSGLSVVSGSGTVNLSLEDAKGKNSQTLTGTITFGASNMVIAVGAQQITVGY